MAKTSPSMPLTSRIRDRAAIPEPERAGARALLRPGRLVGHRSAISTRKGGGFYGYRVHAAVCARTELPVAWRVETARAHESSLADDLLQRVRGRKFRPETV